MSNINRKYDDNGNLTYYGYSISKIKATDTIWAKFEYDDKDRLVNIINNMGNSQDILYDEQDNITYFGDSNQWLRFEYDDRGNVIYEVGLLFNGSEAWHRYEYDDNNILISYEDSDGNWWDMKRLPKVKFPFKLSNPIIDIKSIDLRTLM